MKIKSYGIELDVAYDYDDKQQMYLTEVIHKGEDILDLLDDNVVQDIEEQIMEANHGHKI